MSALQKTASLAQATLRRSALYKNSVRFISKEERDAYRAKMQAPGDTPVYLRGGTGDKVLFGITCASVGALVLHTVYRVYCRM